MAKRSIVLLINSLLSGGAEKQSLYLTKLLFSEHEVLLVVLNDQCSLRNKAFLEKHNIQPAFLTGSFLRKVWAFYKILKKNRVEVIFSFLFTANILSAVIGKLANVKYIIGGFRGSMGYGSFRNAQARFFHNRVNHLTICNSHAGHEYLKKQNFRASKLAVVHNGIDVSQKHVPHPSGEIVHILSVGRFDRLKDYHTAIKSIGLLNKMELESIQFRYTIMGYGEEEIRQQIVHWSEENSIENMVELVIDPIDVDPIFSRSNIYLSTSIYEGFSNSIMEAMLYGLPVIATDVGDNKYLIEEGSNGFLVETRDTEKIASLLHQFVISPEKRNEMGMASRRIVDRKFGLDHLSESYLRIIQNLDK